MRLALSRGWTLWRSVIVDNSHEIRESFVVVAVDSFVFHIGPGPPETAQGLDSEIFIHRVSRSQVGVIFVQVNFLRSIVARAVLGGPLVIVLVGILASSIPVLLGAIATIAFVGGFVTLVARAKPRAKQDDGWDDGAVL